MGGLTESTPIDKDSSSAQAFLTDNPFAKGTPAGEGWRGAVGRIMLGCGKNYWLGMEDASDSISQDEEWARSLGERFQGGRSRHRRGGTRSSVGTSIGSFQEAQAGPGERERRRRAGTGPPPAPSNLGVNTNVGPESRSGSVPRVRSIELGDIRK